MGRYIVDSAGEGVVTLRTPNNNYRTSFKLPQGAKAVGETGDVVYGKIHAPAWKAEAVSAGGNYVEPLYGRPRRMVGTVLAINQGTNELTVKTPYEVIVKLPGKYRAQDFEVGSRVGWDNVEMPWFEVEG